MVSPGQLCNKSNISGLPANRGLAAWVAPNSAPHRYGHRPNRSGPSVLSAYWNAPQEGICIRIAPLSGLVRSDPCTCLAINCLKWLEARVYCIMR